MPVSPARSLAFDVLLGVEKGRGFAADLLQSAAGADLKEADRRLATEIVLGTLRWRGELDFQLEKLLGKPCDSLDVEVLSSLRMGAYQIRWLSKVPKSAAVNDSVELTKLARKRSAAGLVNAVLRKCEPAPVRPGDSKWNIEDPDALGGTLHSLPGWLWERWQENYGTTAAPLAWAAVQPPAVSLRVLGGSSEVALVMRQLEEAGIRAGPGRYSENAVVVDPGQHIAPLIAGSARLVIQDEASQLVAGLLGVRKQERVLDLCAAPGLKTSQIANSIEAGLAVACERSGGRLRTMKKLLARWVQSKIPLCLVQLDAAAELPFRSGFTRVLLDAPCSGTGTLARNPEIKWRLRPQDLPRFAARQRQMLRNALPAVASGGRLVYATCSLEPEENEEVVEDVLNGSPGYRLMGKSELAGEFLRLDPLIGESGYFRTRPDLHGTDGFFAAVLVRLK